MALPSHAGGALQGCVRVTWCAHALTQSASLISTSLFLSRVSARDRRGRLVRSCRRTPGHSGSSQSRVQSATPCAARIRCGCVVSWHATAAAESDRAMRLLVPSGCGGGASARVLAVLLPKSSWVFGGLRHDTIGHSDTLLQPCSWSRHVCKPAQQLCVCLCSSHRAVPARRYKLNEVDVAVALQLATAMRHQADFGHAGGSCWWVVLVGRQHCAHCAKLDRRPTTCVWCGGVWCARNRSCSPGLAPPTACDQLQSCQGSARALRRDCEVR